MFSISGLNLSHANSLYQQVLSKNFQIINNLLRKLNQIYSHQQDYQQSINQINQKLYRLQTNTENLHHQFRSSHFNVDNKMNAISNQYAHVVQDINLLKKIIFSSDLSNNRQRNSFRYSLGNQKQHYDDQNSQQFKNQRKKKKCPTMKISQKKNRRDIDSKQSPQNIKSGYYYDKKSKEYRKIKNGNNQKQDLDQNNFGKVLLEQVSRFSQSKIKSSSDNDSQDQQRLNFISKNSLISLDNSCLKKSRMQHKLSLMSKIQKINESIQDSNNIQNNQINKLNIKLNSDLTDKVLSQYNQKVHKQLQKSYQNYKLMFIKLQQNLKNQLLEQQQKNQQRFEELKAFIMKNYLEKQYKKNIIQETERLIDTKLMTVNNNIANLEQQFIQQLSKKVQYEQFNQRIKKSLQMMSRKIHSILDDCSYKFCQKKQTKRAILFLQNKINLLLTQDTTILLPSILNSNLTENLSINQKCLSCHGTLGQNKPFFKTVNLNLNTVNVKNDSENKNIHKQKLSVLQSRISSSSISRNKKQFIPKNSFNQNLLSKQDTLIQKQNVDFTNNAINSYLTSKNSVISQPQSPNNSSQNINSSNHKRTSTKICPQNKRKRNSQWKQKANSFLNKQWPINLNVKEKLVSKK